MSYIDDFVITVPMLKREQYIEFASDFNALFKEFGALRVVECWGHDVQDGKQTDFRKAVQPKPGRKKMRCSPGSNGRINPHAMPQWPEWKP